MCDKHQLPSVGQVCGEDFCLECSREDQESRVGGRAYQTKPLLWDFVTPGHFVFSDDPNSPAWINRGWSDWEEWLVKVSGNS